MATKRLFFPLVGGSLALVALLLGIAGFAAIRAINEQDRSFRLVTHTYTMKETMSGLLTGILALRNVQRSYVQTGDIEQLRQFELLRTNLTTNFNRLWSIPHEPDQLPRIQHFTRMLAEQYEAFKEVVDLMASGDVRSADREMNRSHGIGEMTLLTKMADEIMAAENATLAVNIATTNTANARAKTRVLTGLLLSILVIASSAFFIFRDLRHRLSVERALRHNSALLQDTLSFQHALVNSAAYGIIAADANGRITEFNRTAEKMLGYKSSEVVDKVTVDKFYDPAELAQRATELSKETGTSIGAGFQVLASLPRRGQVEEREWTYIRNDGRRTPVHVSMTAIRGDEGRISGYLGIARDITERRKIARLKNEFVSTVSHELRTPLTSIRGSLGLVLGTFSGQLSAQIKGLLQIAHNNADRLSRLVNDILDVEKIESGKMEFKVQRQPLLPLLQQALDSTQDFARQFNVALQLFDNAADPEVEVDSDRFIQVIVNLLSNAAKFSPINQAVAITVDRHGRMIRISVSDKGKGIPAEFQSRIFEKFAQADSSDSRQKSGTGLGLSITKAMVERMNGLIGFDTQEGVGTTFHVDLPEMSSLDPPARNPRWDSQGLRSAS